MKTTTPASIELVPVDRGGRTEYVWQDGARFAPGSVQYTRDDVVRENARHGYFPELRRLRKKAAVLLQGSRQAIRDRDQAGASRDQAIKERDEFRSICESASEHLGVIAEMVGESGDIGAAWESVNAILEERREMSRVLHHTREELEGVKSADALRRAEAAAEALETLANENTHNEKYPQYCMHCILLNRALRYRRDAEKAYVERHREKGPNNDLL